MILGIILSRQVPRKNSYLSRKLTKMVELSSFIKLSILDVIKQKGAFDIQITTWLTPWLKQFDKQMVLARI